MEDTCVSVSGKSDKNKSFYLFYGACVVAYLLAALVYQCVSFSPAILYGVSAVPFLLCVAGLHRFCPEAFRHWGMRLMLLLLCWVCIALLWNEQYDVFFIQNLPFICSMPIAMLLFYGYGYASAKREIYSGVRVALLICTVLITLAVSTSIIAALMEKTIYTTKAPIVWIGINSVGKARLAFLCHPNDTGLLAAVAFLIALWLCLSCRRRVERVLLIAAMVILYCATALTVSRTDIIILCVGAGLMGFRFVFFQCKRRTAVMRVLFAGLTFAVLFVGLFLLTSGVGKAYNQFKTVQGAAQAEALAAPEPNSVSDETGVVSDNQPAAPAATAAPTQVSVDRITETETSFSGRTVIWRIALHELRAYPERILFGMTPYYISGALTQAFYEAAHWYQVVNNVHNAYLELLVDFGLPALLLFCAFIVLLAICSIRAFFRPCKEDAVGIGYLPAILVPILLVGIMEAILGAVVNQQFSNLVFFLLAGILFGQTGLKDR